MTFRFGSAIAGVAAVSCLAFATPARAQAPPDSVTPPPVTAPPPAPVTTPAPAVASPVPAPAPATLLRGGELGELLSVYVPRGSAEIDRLLEGAREMERSSGRQIDDARRLATEADGRVKIMKEELNTTKVRRDVAKKAKDTATRTTLDATVKTQTREVEYLERLRDAMRADAERLDAERDAASARVKALELESKVARRYAELGSSPGGSAVEQYRSMLRQLLDAQSRSADRWGDAAEKLKRVADRRLKQMQSLGKLSK